MGKLDNKNDNDKKDKNIAYLLVMYIIQVVQQFAFFINNKSKESELKRRTLETINKIPEIQNELCEFFRRYPLPTLQALAVEYPGQIDVKPLSYNRYQVALPRSSTGELTSFVLKQALPELILQNLATIRQVLPYECVNNAPGCFPVLYSMRLISVSEPAPGYLGLTIEV